MNTVHLHGALAKHGGPYRLAVSSPREAARALALQIPGFRADMAAGHFRVIAKSKRYQLDIGEDQLDWRFAGEHEVHIVPVVAGASGRGKGGMKILAGLAIIALSIVTAGGAAAAAGAAAAGSGAAGAAGMSAAAISAFGGALTITYGQIAMFGLSMVLSGVSTLMTPQPKMNVQQNETADRRPSFLFNNGAMNLVEQGNPIPLVYGRYRCGSVVVSAGLRAEQI